MMKEEFKAKERILRKKHDKDTGAVWDKYAEDLLIGSAPKEDLWDECQKSLEEIVLRYRDDLIALCDQ